MAEQSRRFVSLDKPIDKFIEDQKNKNTLSKTRRDVSLLTARNHESNISTRGQRTRSNFPTVNGRSESYAPRMPGLRARDGNTVKKKFN